MRDIYARPIEHHGGAKYLRTIREAGQGPGTLKVDVYCVIDAFDVTCPALQHALKKVLACGQRGKGDALDDIRGALDALWRAYDFEVQRVMEKENGAAPVVTPSEAASTFVGES